MNKVDLSQYQNQLSRKNQLARFIWNIVWLFLARPLPRRFGNRWNLLLLRLFGAKVHPKAVVYSSVRIYMPWHIEMHEWSCLGPEVDCYNVAKITIGSHATVSQKTFLCAASHNVNVANYPLITQPIHIKEQAWIGADAFIGLGVTIGEGAVVGARAAVFKDVDPWTIVGGNPAKVIKKREIN